MIEFNYMEQNAVMMNEWKTTWRFVGINCNDLTQGTLHLFIDHKANSAA